MHVYAGVSMLPNDSMMTDESVKLAPANDEDLSWLVEIVADELASSDRVIRARLADRLMARLSYIEADPIDPGDSAPLVRHHILSTLAETLAR